MSNVHIKLIEDENTGDVYDALYWHHGCAPEDVLGWPAPEALDYMVFCEGCGYVIEAVPLTKYGEDMHKRETQMLKGLNIE